MKLIFRHVLSCLLLFALGFSGFSSLEARSRFLVRTVYGPGQTVALWTPSLLGASIVAWYDASDNSKITQSSNFVTSWGSEVGSLSVTNATTGRQPVYSATARNGKPGVTFDGVNEYLSSASISTLPTGANTIVAVGYSSGSSTVNQTAVIWGGAGSGLSRILGYRNNGTNQIWSSNYSLNDVNQSPNWDSDRIIIVDQSSNVTPTFNRSVDGTVLSPAGPGSSTAISSPSPLVLGTLSISSYTGAFSGTLQEILILNRTLTGDERVKLEGYEAWKWNLVGNLPANHPYKTAPPTVF